MFGPRVVEAVAAGRRGARSTGAMRTLLGNKAGGASEPAGGTETAEAGADIGGRAVPIPTSPVPNWPPPDAADGSAAQPAADAGQVVADLRGRIQRAMTVGAGVLRSGESLANARSELEAVGAELAGRARTQAAEEVRNLADLGVAMIDVALARRESRGCHTREDFPDRLDDFRVRLLIGG